MAELERRSRAILTTIVAEYIATGEPVGSRTLSKRPEVGLSAASIRNIMSDLSEWGYIAQPHVSAGRVPTDLGYRMYVDTMVRREALTPPEQRAIESVIAAAGLDMRDLLRKSSSVLAELSRKTGVVTAVAPPEQTFKIIEFIKVSEDRVLVVLVSTGGFVQNKLIYDEADLGQETLERYSRMLTDMLKDLDLRQAREKIEQELAQEKTRVDAVLAKALRMSHMILSHQASREIFIEGQVNIIEEPEFAHVEVLRAVLATFEEKTNLLKILDKVLEAEAGLQIMIGSEHGLGEIGSCSIVAYPIRTGESVFGSIGVIGPKRMNYQKVVSLVDTTGRILTRIVKRLVEHAA